MLRTSLAAAVMAVLSPIPAQAQDRPPPMRPAEPGSPGPAWQRSVRMSDGRTFVTDGGMAIDAALARPATLPADVLPPSGAAALERHMAGPAAEEVPLSRLSRRDARAYATPGGVHLSATYVDFLRRVAPDAVLRPAGAREPVAIVAAGRMVGVLMPLAR
jgi:hypothetical protein